MNNAVTYGDLATIQLLGCGIALVLAYPAYRLGMFLGRRSARKDSTD